MAKEVNASDVEAAVRSLVSAQRTNLGIEVTVPVAYGDGEIATVIVEGATEALIVHDAGFSAMRLASAGVSLQKHTVARLNDYAKRYHCSFVDGRVTANATIDNVATVACLVANASRSVADYVYEIRRQALSELDNICPGGY